MATFFIALLLFCFTISNKATRFSVAVMSIMVVVLVVWSIGALEYKLAREVSHNSLAVLRRTTGNLFKRVMYFNPFHARRAPRHDPQDGHITMAERVGRV